MVLHVLGLLAALLAAVAALFLIQTALTLLMTVAFVTLLIAGFTSRRNTYSWSSAGISRERSTDALSLARQIKLTAVFEQPAR